GTAAGRRDGGGGGGRTGGGGGGGGGPGRAGRRCGVMRRRAGAHAPARRPGASAPEEELAGPAVEVDGELQQVPALRELHRHGPARGAVQRVQGQRATP